MANTFAMFGEEVEGQLRIEPWGRDLGCYVCYCFSAGRFGKGKMGEEIAAVVGISTRNRSPQDRVDGGREY